MTSTSRGSVRRSAPGKSDDEPKLPGAKVAVRIDRALRERLLHEMETTNASLSSVLRLALTVGLERVEELPEAFRRASFREGIIAGMAEYKRVQASGAQDVPVKRERR